MKKKTGNPKKQVLIVKRRGHTERFDEKKLYASVYAACSITGMKEKQCEAVASSVNNAVKKSLARKKKVNSHEIMEKAAAALKKKSKEAAFMYETHMDVS